MEQRDLDIRKAISDYATSNYDGISAEQLLVELIKDKNRYKHLRDLCIIKVFDKKLNDEALRASCYCDVAPIFKVSPRTVQYTIDFRKYYED